MLNYGMNGNELIFVREVVNIWEDYYSVINSLKHTKKGEVISPLPFHEATHVEPYQLPRTWFALPPGSNASDVGADQA